tara:strand:+ start:8160 stop:9200 length:1041 start_codon:yes stop_codon:yes gene_type:complete
MTLECNGNERLKQDAPNAVQIELTEGCNLACSFCGIQQIRDNGADGPSWTHGKNSKEYKFMTRNTLLRVLTNIKNSSWNPRFEFAMHGEPTMHPEYCVFIQTTRQYFPKASIMMTSNGGGLLGNVSNKVNDLMDAGLNILFLDNYERIRIVDKIKANYNGPHKVVEYPQNPEGNPHKRRKPKEKLIVVGADLTIATSGTHAQVSNHAGSAFPLNYKQQDKRCAKPFRELSVRWDGNVALCCNDWTGIYKCGNIHDYNGMDELWNNDAFYSARVKLYHGQRNFGACNGCDNTTIRNGLLPDRMGKYELPKPTAMTNNFIEQACGGNSYTKAVKPVYDFINLPSDKLI